MPRPCSRSVPAPLPLLLALLLGAALLPAALATPAHAAPGEHRLIPSAVPATTPNILDGRTLAIAEIGTRVYVGGTFTTAQNPGTSAQLTTPYLFAYDRTTGRVDAGFAPGLDASVTAVVPSADGTALFVGGTFKLAGSTKVRNLIKIDATTGALVTAFKNPSPNGTVLDLALVGERLLVAGTFTTILGSPRAGLASLSATTGALDSYLTVGVDVNHNWPSGAAKAPIGVGKLAASPDGSRVVAIGNFKMAGGLERDQVMVLRLTPDAAVVDPDWRTLRYTPACAKDAFDSYVRDVAFAPDGSYFVVASSGAGYNGTLCDSAARFDVAVTGQAVEPTWVAATGQDSLLSVAISSNAVYVGGHQKWLNAVQSGADQQPGQLPRPGLAALDPLNGLPLRWNPGRNPRGVGAEELLVTDQGLYVGSDTSYIGDGTYRRERLAFFPVAGGTPPATQPDPVLPRTLYRLSSTTATTREFTGTSATAATPVATTGGTSWTGMRGAFMIGSTLVYGWSDNQLHSRTFDGATFGPDVVIDPYNDPVWSNVTIGGGSTTTYRGRVPTLYGQLSGVTAMTYADGRIYYTRSGQRSVFWRWFSPESLVVGAQEFTLAGSSVPSQREVRNLFYAGGQLYAGWSSNELWRLPVVDAVAGGSWTRVSGSGVDTNPTWSSGTVFVGPTANQAPDARLAASCTGQTCTFDAAGSTDADGTVVGYAWDLGDGQAATGARVEHTYAGPGTYSVRLTVTDDRGGTGSATRDIVIDAPVSPIAFRGSTAKVTNAVSVSSPVPAGVVEGDGLLAVVSASTTAVPAAPAGWTQVGSPVLAENLTTVVWQRVARANDAGQGVTVSLGATAVKATLTVLAYSGTDAAGPVADLADAVETTTSLTHRSPVVSSPGGWVVTVWTDRSSYVTSFIPPAGVTQRHQLIGTGGGHVDTLVADTGGPVAAGGYGNQTATTDVASKGASLSIALR